MIYGKIYRTIIKACQVFFINIYMGREASGSPLKGDGYVGKAPLGLN